MGGRKSRPNYEPEYRELVEAERKQKELFAAEMQFSKQEHASRIQNIQSAISESNKRIEELKRNNEIDKAAKEKELHEEQANHVARLKEIDAEFERNKAKLGDEAKEQLAEIQRNSKSEREELGRTHNKTVEDKKHELNELKESQKAAIDKIEEEKNKLNQERKDAISEHSANIAAMRSKFLKENAEETDKVKELKKALLAWQRGAIKAQSEEQVNSINKLLEAQIIHHTGNMERTVADSVAHMIKPFASSSYALKQLAESIKIVEEESNPMNWLMVKNFTSEWAENNICTQNATLRLRQLLNNYSSVNQGFRNNILEITNEIDKNVLDLQAVPIAIERAVDNENVDALMAQFAKVEKQIEFLNETNSRLIRVCAPPDRTMEAIQANSEAITNSVKSIKMDSESD